MEAEFDVPDRVAAEVDHLPQSLLGEVCGQSRVPDALTDLPSLMEDEVGDGILGWHPYNLS